MPNSPLVLSPSEETLARQVLHYGLLIRQLMAKAPFFGPHTSPGIEKQLWADLTTARVALASVLDGLAEPEVRAHFMLEAEGVGEKYYTALIHLRSEHERLGLSPAEREKAELTLFEREMTFLRGRISAIRGEWDPEYRDVEDGPEPSP